MTGLHIVHSKLTPHEEGLSTIIANAWRGPFVHSFHMPQRKGNAAVWWNWRKQKGFVSETWTCSSLSDAAKQYAWDDIAKPSSETLRQNIINSIHRQDVESLRTVCLAIFKWGGVGRRPADPSRIWVTTTHGSDLIAGVTRAVELLKGNDDPAQFFDGKSLLMNSAMTKVYAFADPIRFLVIYDGRVGAALGLFVIQYCRSKGETSVPAELNFGWHDSIAGKGLRNPNRENYRFSRLTKGDAFHASCMWRANRILSIAAQKARCTSLELERSMFMVGYDLSHWR